MSKLTGSTWVPLSVLVLSLLTFGGASFTVGIYHQRYVTTETEVQVMKGDIKEIRKDVAEIKSRLPLRGRATADTQYTPPAYPRFEARRR